MANTITNVSSKLLLYLVDKQNGHLNKILSVKKWFCFLQYMGPILWQHRKLRQKVPTFSSYMIPYNPSFASFFQWVRGHVFRAPLEAVLWRWSLWALHPSLNIDKIGIPVSFGKSTFSIILGISLMSLSSTRRAPPVSWHPYMTSAEYHDMASTSAKGFWKRIDVRVTGDSNRGSGSTPDCSMPTRASKLLSSLNYGSEESSSFWNVLIL